MSSFDLRKEYDSLPSELKKEVEDFVSFLNSKTNKAELKERKFGCGKGFFVIKPGFYDPLEDFKEYMQ